MWSKGGVEDDCIKARWLKWRLATRVLCEKKVLLNLKRGQYVCCMDQNVGQSRSIEHESRGNVDIW